MTTTATARNPSYAPADHVLTVIHRARERGVPDPITPTEMGRLGIPAGMIGRTIHALRYLGLVDDEGRHTELVQRLRRATTEEYPDVLAGVIQAAYADVFGIVDPAEDTDVAISDAFRHYEPAAQRDRMVRLFMRLCQEAGITRGATAEATPRPRRQTVGTPRRQRQVQPPRRAEHRDAVVEEEPIREAEPQTDYRLISALIQQLPREGRWTKHRRDLWILAVSAAIDLLIEVTEEVSTA